MAEQKEKKITGKKDADKAMNDPHAGHDHANAQGKAPSEPAQNAKAKETKEAKPKEKKAKKSRKIIIKATKQALAAKKIINLKIWLPTFRGSFGQKSIRKIKKAKWSKWHVGRGIDKNHDQSEGNVPRGGYRTMKKIRHMHPSGYNETKVRTANELSGVKKGNAIRVIAGIGRRKKMEIVDKAIGMGIKVLNP